MARRLVLQGAGGASFPVGGHDSAPSPDPGKRPVGFAGSAGNSPRKARHVRHAGASVSAARISSGERGRSVLHSRRVRERSSFTVRCLSSLRERSRAAMAAPRQPGSRRRCVARGRRPPQVLAGEFICQGVETASQDGSPSLLRRSASAARAVCEFRNRAGVVERLTSSGGKSIPMANAPTARIS